MPTLKAGTMAPRFALNNVDGSARTEPAFNRLTVLAFYKVTCPTCQLGIPYLDGLEGYAASGLETIGVAQDPPDAIREFRETFGGRMPTLTEPPPYETSSAYGLTNVPTILLVEPGGRIVRTIIWFSKPEYNELADEIARRLSVAPVELCPENDGAPAFKPG